MARVILISECPSIFWVVEGCFGCTHLLEDLKLPRSPACTQGEPLPNCSYSPNGLQRIAMTFTPMHAADTPLTVAASRYGSEAQQADDYQSALW
jgi:hypothetical protein